VLLVDVGDIERARRDKYAAGFYRTILLAGSVDATNVSSNRCICILVRIRRRGTCTPCSEKKFTAICFNMPLALCHNSIMILSISGTATVMGPVCVCVFVCLSLCPDNNI